MESQRRFTEIRPMANYRDRFVVQSLVGGDTGYGYGRLWAAMGGALASRQRGETGRARLDSMPQRV